MNDTSNFYFAFRHEASSSEVLIPYALFATFEMAPNITLTYMKKLLKSSYTKQDRGKNRIIYKFEKHNGEK